MTTTELQTHLRTSLQLFASYLGQVSDEAWNQDQAGKWTLAQETDHVLKAGQRTALLFSPAGRTVWKANERPSRSYETVVTEYLTGLAANPTITNRTTAPDTEAPQPGPAEQLAQWQQAGEALITNVAGLTDEELDGFTVWKHPLIGPVTAREMLYFTSYHTRHHANSLARKLGVSAA